MWLKSTFPIFCVIACVLAEKDVTRKTSSEAELTRTSSPSEVPRNKAIPIEEFVTSHKLPENIPRPSADEDDDADADLEKKTAVKDGRHVKKVISRFENLEKKSSSLEPIRRLDSESSDEEEGSTAKRQVRVELENFGGTGVLQEDGIKKTDGHRSREESQKDSVIPGVYVSAEYPTTMMPVLTTPREARGFDFVPVNIIREDGKDAYASFADRNFGDLGDVSLVPAGTNSRIQVKKGPNGKDYEYEYVYYYYDEEDESKAGTAGSAVTNSYDIPSRTTSAPRRGGSTSNRGKYNSVERSSTVEPASNEVIPNRNGNRGRQLVEAEDVSEERLPTNTRFPPRSRSNHNTGTTEATRARGNRPRPGLDLVDSSSFRTHQEGPEFPQVLPKGPVRFLGVTPNEDNEEKSSSRGRGRPQRVQEPAPVEEVVEDVPAPTTRRRPVTTAAPEEEVELNRGQPARSTEEEEEEEGEEQEEETSPLPEKIKERQSSSETKQDSEESESSSPTSSSTASIATENPTTEYPSAMDKVALDLYAFLQQGQSNLVDASSSEANDSGDGTTLSTDEATTDLATTTELSPTTLSTETTTISTTTTTTTTEPTTTTTTTTEPPTTTTQAPAGRGKFRRPGIGGPAISRNRFKSNGGGGTTSTEAPAETTQRTRGRFGGNGSNGSGFKRPRPGQKPVEEDAVQKESTSSVNAEKPAGTRNRFRGTGGTRSTISTTTSAPSNGGSATTSGSSGISRPTFNKLNINRRRGRPTTAAPSASEESQESTHAEAGNAGNAGKETTQETVTAAPKSNVRARLPGTAVRPPVIRPGARVNLRQKPGQTTTTTTLSPETSDASSVEEPAGEGTEEETHEAPAETSPPPTRSTTVNPLNKLRNRNRLQVHPKTTTRSPVSLAPRRSPLLPRRKVTEAPVVQTSQEEVSESQEETSSSETETTEATSAETSTAASTKHEETRGLSGLLTPRRRITPRRPGQIISRE